MTLPGTSSPQFVLLQTFSPGASGGGAHGQQHDRVARRAVRLHGTDDPKLVSVRLNNADNVLGPLQFDNNINTNPQISSEISLLGQHGSTVTLGNVIVLPFNNDSFLYIRPLYVTAAANGGTAFPQLQEVIVGTQNGVAQGTSFSAALQALLNTTQPIPGLTNPETGDADAVAVAVAVSRPRRRARAPLRRRAPTGSLQQQILALDSQDRHRQLGCRRPR